MYGENYEGGDDYEWMLREEEQAYLLNNWMRHLEDIDQAEL